MKKLFNFRLLVLIGVLIMSVSQMWGAETVSFANGETIYYNFSNVAGNSGADYWTGDGTTYNNNTEGTIKVVTFAAAKSATVGETVMIKCGTGDWSELMAKARSTGNNMLIVASNGKSYDWGTARTFKSGKKIYFQDYSSTMSTLGGSIHWKTTDGNVYAKFYDGSSWTRSSNGALVSGSWDGDNAIYEIEVPGSDKTFTKVVFYRGDKADNTSEWNLTTEQMPALGQNMFTVADSKSGSNWVGSWSKYAYEAAIIGSFNDWDPCEGMCSTGSTIRAIITLAAETSYEFKVLEGSSYWGCDLCGSITNTTDAWQLYDSQKNLTITTGEAGEYCFHWDKTNNKVTVYYPQARLKKQTYIYFDARNSDASHWNSLSPIAARFYFKYYDSGSDETNSTVNTPLETSVLYTTVPNNDYIGKVQINRMSSDKGTQYDDKTNLMSASTRTNSEQNCLVIPAGQSSAWSPTVNWTTYCPIKETSTIEDNGTIKTWGGSGTSGSPFYVATGSKIKVSGSSSDYFSDGNMTTKYDFQVRNASDVQQTHSDGEATTYEYTVPATNDVVYKLRVNSYNYYNSTSSTAKWSTDIYYKARTPYTISYNKGTYGSGSRDNETKLKGINFTLPNSPVFTRDHYTQTGWTTSNGGSQTHALGGSYTSDVAQEFFPVWTDNKHTVTLGNNGHGHVEIGGETVTSVSGVGIATVSGSITAVANTGYHFDSWTLPGDGSVTIASGDGTATITINATADSKTVTANFAANSYTLTLDDQFGTTAFYVAGEGSKSVTFDANTNLTSRITIPQREGYTFGGYYTETSGEGTQIIDKNGDVKASASDPSNTYTDASRNWKYAGNLRVYAKWTDNNVYYFYGGASGTNTAWGTAANWTKGAAPSDMDNHTVIILKPAQVTADATVTVKNVRIANAGSYTPTNGSAITAAGTLTIPATGALVVKEDIKNYNVSTSAASTTTWRTLHILSSSSGTGALVTGNRVEHDTASVSFYTKACQPSVGKYVNQFFGIPFSSSSVNNYYGVYLYKHDAATNAFTPSSSATMTAFTAYLMLRTDLSPATLYMEGELLLPGTSDTYKGKDLSLIGASGKKVSNMFANSWTAPIDLRAMTSADFDGVEATFYLFNAGKSDDTNAGKAGDGAGQWTVLPVEAIKTDWSADSDLDDYPQYVLPSQQAFLVVATTDEEKATHTLKLDYEKHVYNPAVANGVTIEPTRAPRRDDFVLPEQINLYATGASGNSDRVIIYSREDFSMGFDNGWEGYKITGSDFAPQMYTLSDNGNMAINAIPNIEGSVIGFKPGTEDVQYTFTFKYRGENTWYLNDLKEQTSTLIDELDSYTFTSADGDMEARFIISRTPIAHVPTGIDNGGGAVEGVSVRKLMIDGTLYIIRNGQMFTAEGQMVK